MNAWTGEIPAALQERLCGDVRPAEHSLAYWDGRWQVDMGARRRAAVVAGRPVIACTKGEVVGEQPCIWNGWCLLHQGEIPQPERLWIGRVQSPTWALLRRLVRVGERWPHDKAVADTMALLSDATMGPHTAFVGDPGGRVYVVRLDGQEGYAGAVEAVLGLGWAAACTGTLPGGRPVAVGVTALDVAVGVG